MAATEEDNLEGMYGADHAREKLYNKAARTTSTIAKYISSPYQPPQLQQS
jgi:hypothetical protein